MKILVVAPAWIGDAIMAQPLYQRLKQHYAHLTLEVLAPAWSRPLLERMPEVNLAIDNPFAHGQLQLWQRWQLARQLKKKQYDQAIILPNSFKSALIPWFAGIPIRTGYLGEQRYPLLNDIRKLDKQSLPRMVDRFTVLAIPGDSLILTSEECLAPFPRLRVDSLQRAQTLTKFDLTLNRPIAAFCPGAEYGPAKRWPPEHFAALARHLQQKGYQIWLFGASKEISIAEHIVQQSGLHQHIYNLCGKTTLQEAIDLLSTASVVISNDSGLMHVAAALHRPLIALYGSSSPIFTPPLSELAHIVRLELPCSPCFKRSCPLTHFNCMRQLPPEHIATVIEKMSAPSHEIGSHDV